MSLRTSASLIVFGIACLSCTVPVPQPPRLTIAIDGKARAQVPAPPTLEVQGELGVEAQAEYVAIEVAPPQPTVAVELQGAAVVEFFGIPLDAAQDVVFVLDRSGSMDDLALGQIAQLAMQQGPSPTPSSSPPPPGDLVPPPPPGDDAMQDLSPANAPPNLPQVRKIDVAQAELTNALERLPAGTRMNLLYFNDRLTAHQASITPLQESDREAVIAFVRKTLPHGTTALAPAMRTAYLMNAKRIVLLSDGLGNVGGDAAAVLRDAREAMRGGVRIDTIGLGQDQDAWLLQSLAQESSGIYQQL